MRINLIHYKKYDFNIKRHACCDWNLYQEFVFPGLIMKDEFKFGTKSKYVYYKKYAKYKN